MFVTITATYFFETIHLIVPNPSETFKFCVKRIASKSPLFYSLTPLIDTNHRDFVHYLRLFEFEFETGSIVEVVLKFGDDTILIVNDFEDDDDEFEIPIRPIQF
jgi:hypothetical protein